MKRSEDSIFETYERKEITFLIIFGIIMAIGLPVIIIGFITGGFEESFVSGKPLTFGTILLTLLIYIFFLFFGLLGLPALKNREMDTVKKGENVAQQKHPDIMSVAIIHDPNQDGFLWALFKSLGFKDEKNPMRFSLSMLRMFVISIIIFSSLGLFVTFTSAPQLAFQITPTMEIFLSAEPASFAETTMAIFFLSLLLGIDAFLVSKFKLPSFVYWIVALIIVCPLLGIGWQLLHSIVYGNSEINLFRTFIFGWVGSTLTVLFGTFIPWYVFHFANNFFSKIVSVYSSMREDVIFISLTSIILLTAIWITIELALRKYKKKKREIY